MNEQKVSKETLSKHKYVYLVKIGSDGTIHVHKLPVVYANSNVVYYLPGKGQEPARTAFKNIRESIVGYMKTQSEKGFNPTYGINNALYWFVGGDPNEVKKQLVAANDTRLIERQFQDAKGNMIIAQAEAKRAAQKAEDAKAHYEELLEKYPEYRNRTE